MGLREDLDDLWRYVTSPRDPEGQAFDARFGTETRWFDLLGNYEPSRPSVVDAALDALDVLPAAYTFVDVGCGKGRVLILAAARGFRAVVGIEPVAAHRRVAAANLAAAARRVPAAAAATVIAGDADHLALPDGPAVVYLYNPFPGPQVRAVLDAIGRRPARLVYVTPAEGATVAMAGWQRVVRGGEGGWRWEIWRPPRDG